MNSQITDSLANWLKVHPKLRVLSGLARGKQGILLDYPVNPRARYSTTHPHPELQHIIEQSKETYLTHLKSFNQFSAHWSSIDFWQNDYLSALDGISIYSYLALQQPATYLEVGSGISTKFARQAISDHNLSTKIISIDPQPRAEIDKLCDQVIRQPLESVDLSLFINLAPDDIVFIDNSHQAFPNSDVTVFFLDILPRLPAKILVGIHDIFLPADYPQSVALNYYSEQYLLAAYLLGGAAKINIELATWYATHHPDFIATIAELFKVKPLTSLPRHGGAFWLATALTRNPSPS